MLTPAVASKVLTFNAFSGTPAESLTRTLPQGVDASILSLDSGDVRNILFTAYSEQGFLRNIVLLSFLVDGLDTDQQLDRLWDVYYHFYIDEAAFRFLTSQVAKLVAASATLETWRASAYGKLLRFCNRATFEDFQAGLAKYNKAISNKNNKSFASDFKRNIARSPALHEELHGDRSTLAGFRSLAPAIMGLVDVTRGINKYWQTGATASAPVPNPTFAASISENVWLEGGADPYLGYHLSPGYIGLTKASPLRVGDNVPGELKRHRAARTEFRAAVRAFQAMRDQFTIRFVTGESLELCFALANCASSGRSEFTANWYRRHLDGKRLDLDPSEYGASSDKSGPVMFDVIDTSGIADHFGPLNVLVATIPLLSNEPFATVHTQLMLRPRDASEDRFESILCGDTQTVALLLGVTPVEFYTNVRTTSGFDSSVPVTFTGLDNVPAQLISCLSWKQSHHFAGEGGLKKMTVAPDELVLLLTSVYEGMYSHENLDMIKKMVAERMGTMIDEPNLLTYPCFHRGSFAAFMRFVKDRVNTDWETVCSRLLKAIGSNRTTLQSSSYIFELAGSLHMFGAYTESWLNHPLLAPRSIGGVHAWPTVPTLVATTFVVPRAILERLYRSGSGQVASPTFSVGIRSFSGNPFASYHNKFDNLQLVFGTVSTKGSRDSPDFEVEVAEDPKGWQGTSPLIVCFYMPAAALAKTVPADLVSLELYSSKLTNMMLVEGMDKEETIMYETRYGDTSRVFISKFMPGQCDYMRTRPPPPPIAVASPDPSRDGPADLSMGFNKSSGKVSTVAGRVNINTVGGKRLLQDAKVGIKVEPTSSPFVLNIVFGHDYLVLPVHFTVPVDSETSRLRIARKSSWIEVVAHVADPAKSACLQGLVYPATIDPTPRNKGLPVTLSVLHVNLDTLPIIDLTKLKDMDWIAHTTSYIFTARERLLREENGPSSLDGDARHGVKSSLFLMLTLAMGVYGKSTYVFAISDAKKSMQMLVFVSALRIDLGCGSIIADAAVMPFTRDAVPIAKMEAFVNVCNRTGVRNIVMDDGVMAVWKKMVPSMVERSRTWMHGPQCEYALTGTIPLSLESSEPVICSCGRGKLPPKFVGVPMWDEMKQYATRIALSPMYNAPFAEDSTGIKMMADELREKGPKMPAAMVDALDPSLLSSLRPSQPSKSGKSSKSNKSNKSSKPSKPKQSGQEEPPAASMTNNAKAEPSTLSEAEARDLANTSRPVAGGVCSGCGIPDAPLGRPLKLCSGCRNVKYCSTACQKQHRKEHKPDCDAAKAARGA